MTLTEVLCHWSKLRKPARMPFQDKLALRSISPSTGHDVPAAAGRSPQPHYFVSVASKEVRVSLKPFRINRGFVEILAAM